MDHAYNFQENAYGCSDVTRAADNQASEANVAVDPTLQVIPAVQQQTASASRLLMMVVLKRDFRRVQV